MALKDFKNQKGFIDLNNETSRTEVVQGIYNEVYPTKIGFEALIPFESVRERNQRVTRRKPLKFTVTTGEDIGKIYEQKGVIFEEYSKAEYVEENITIDKAFTVARKYSPLETLTPELIAADLSEAAVAETQYKRKALLDTALEAPKLILDKLDLRKDALQIHDKIIDHCYEMGMNIENLWIFSDIELNRGFRDQLKLTIGATQQIQDVLDGKGVTISGIQSSVEGINYVGIPKKVAVLDPTGKAGFTTNLLPEGIIVYVVEMNPQYRPFKAMEWTHTPLRCEKNPVGNGEGAVDIMEYAKGYDVKLIESLKVFAVTFEPETPPTEPEE